MENMVQRADSSWVDQDVCAVRVYGAAWIGGGRESWGGKRIGTKKTF